MYYSDNYATFDEWVSLVSDNNELVVPFCKIPYREWLEDYLENVHNRSVEEVKDLLRCLLRPFTREADISNYKIYFQLKQSEITTFAEMASTMSNIELYHRVKNGQEAWEGLTWVLEFLPSRPYKAIKALENYVISESSLPDDRIIGIDQCAEIIMEKFINFENPLEKLTSLKPIEFEWLIEELYKWMGYETTWTPSTRDGGKDIIASIKRPDGNEIVYVECKLYKTTKLTIKDVRNLHSVITNDKVNRGVIFCTGYVNDNLGKFDSRIQIWSYDTINVLLNAHLGINWAERLDIVLDNKKRELARGKSLADN
ncbi:restriction endonuclease [Psychrobacillus sp. BL-248-WT-3]|uniref:restriction endonuclease n=1 Tax=Psychrobacillus sp. BL-248-WT-3 TaxID=2725306 RepID=UPI00146EDC64|nr:restriction endonuclease [Psychrobacillus sp. BL-248-WT-3]NME07236.1 restriction endonuclease [Psychrobacillus sp. BL-248-WT-3]